MSAAPPRQSGGRDLGGVAIILTASAFFATLGPLSEFADRGGVSSLTLVAWRAALGASCVALVVGARRLGGRSSGLVPLATIPVRDRWFVAAAAVANTVLNLSVFIAFQRVGITLSLLVFYLYPAFVALVSVLWMGERLDRLRWAALAVSMSGMALVVAGAGDLGELDLIGVGLAFVAAMTQVFYVLAARHGFARVPGPQAAAMTMGGAFLLYLLIAAPIGMLVSLGQPLASVEALWPVLLAGVLGAGLPTVSFIIGIRRLGPSPAAILATLEPVVGVALAAWLLAEQPTSVQLIGGAFILAAAVLLQLRPAGPVADHEAVQG